MLGSRLTASQDLQAELDCNGPSDIGWPNPPRHHPVVPGYLLPSMSCNSNLTTTHHDWRTITKLNKWTVDLVASRATTSSADDLKFLPRVIETGSPCSERRTPEGLSPCTLARERVGYPHRLTLHDQDMELSMFLQLPACDLGS